MANILTAAITLVTLGLWAGTHLMQGSFPPFWLAMSQASGFIAMALMCVALMAGTRARAIEPFFGPLDHAIAFHRRIGPASLFALLAHVLTLVPYSLASGFPLGDLFLPFFSPATRNLDIMTTYGLLLLGALAYARRLSYQAWRNLHRLTGPLFLATAAHLFLVEGTLRQGDALRLWTVVLVALGAWAWLYRVLLYRRLGPRHEYAIEQVARRGHDTVDLLLKPVDRRMIWHPGAFLFISLPGLPGLHPFSISSSPTDRLLRLSIREVGDFTRRLEGLAKGMPATLYGPFGGFTPNAFVAERRLVWVGAGIGITPFLSMLAFEQANNDFRRIWLFYVARTPADAPYAEEIEAQIAKADSFVEHRLWLTGEQGRLTAARIAEEVAPFDDYAVMLCGPRLFLADMRRQFRALDLPDRRIIAEEFDIRS